MAWPPAAGACRSGGESSDAAAARADQHASLLAAIQSLPPGAPLAPWVEAHREELTTGFLSWVSDQCRPGRGGGSGGGGTGSGGGIGAPLPLRSAEERAALSRLVAQLTELKEAAGARSGGAVRLLYWDREQRPPRAVLASSCAHMRMRT